MKKWHIYGIIGVLTLALMGLAYVQSIYIKRGLVIQNQIFNQYVNDALVRVAVKIEEEAAFKMLNRPRLEKIYDKVQSSNGSCGIRLQYQNGLILLDVEKENESFSFIGTTLSEIDSLVKLADLGEEIESELTGGLLEGYNEMLEDLTMQFLYGNTSSPSYDSSQIHNFLNYELDRIAINTPFDFALLDGYTFRQFFSTFKILNPALQNNAYKTSIHTSPLSGDHAILLVDFPKKRSFLLKSNSELLSSSFIFILLIVTSFGASIFIIFKQKKLSELKTDFINNMTHELKTPVATISLATQMLNKEKVRQDETKIQNYVAIIGDENKRLGTHIERVLQIAQLDKDTLNLSKDLVDIHILLEDTLSKFKLRFDDADAQITHSLISQNFSVKADREHLSSVFSNLLDNSIKYKQAGDLHIDIKTYNKLNQLVIEITDNGIGMSNDDQKKIFTKFYRVPTGNVHNVKGFGLGLSYVKTIVEAHHGEISVKSELNKYTTFIVNLPITK